MAASSESPGGTPVPGEVPVMPVKRGRGRPPKPETIARRRLEAQQAAEKAAALAAAQPPPKPVAPKPVIPEAVSDSEEPADVPAPQTVPAPSVAAPPLPLPPHAAAPPSLASAVPPAARSVGPVPTAASTAQQTPSQRLPQPFAPAQTLLQQHQQLQIQPTTVLGKRDQFVINKDTPDSPIDRESAKALASLYSDMQEPLLRDAIDLLSGGHCSPNALYKELGKLPDGLRSRVSKVLPFDPPTKRFALHRGIPQADLFTSPLELSPAELALVSQSKDTDVLELAEPAYLPQTKPPSLRQVAPRPVPVRPNPPSHLLHTPKPVEHLYYSAFSSFAPSYDSSAATLPYRASLSTELLASVDAAAKLKPKQRAASILSPAESSALKSIGVDESHLVSLLVSKSGGPSSTTTGKTDEQDEEMDEAIALNLERLKALLMAQRNRLRSIVPTPQNNQQQQQQLQLQAGGTVDEPYQIPEPGESELSIAKSLSMSLTKLIARVSSATPTKRKSTNVKSETEAGLDTEQVVQQEEEEDRKPKITPKPEEVENAIERLMKQTGTRAIRGTIDALNPLFARPIRMPKSEL